jgi:hypothetical protein
MDLTLKEIFIHVTLDREMGAVLAHTLVGETSLHLPGIHKS